MKYINFSDEDFQRANTIDLARYLQSKGERLKKVGSTYQYIYTDGSGTHDSVTISGANGTTTRTSAAVTQSDFCRNSSA